MTSELNNEAQALEYKLKGNELLKKGQGHEAIQCYTKSIECTPKNNILYSNRGLVYQQLGYHTLALQDADTCLSLDDTWAKGHFRKGVALVSLGMVEEGRPYIEHCFQKESEKSIDKKIQEAIDAHRRDPKLPRALVVRSLIKNEEEFHFHTTKSVAFSICEAMIQCQNAWKEMKSSKGFHLFADAILLDHRGIYVSASSEEELNLRFASLNESISQAQKETSAIGPFTKAEDMIQRYLNALYKSPESQHGKLSTAIKVTIQATLIFAWLATKKSKYEEASQFLQKSGYLIRSINEHMHKLPTNTQQMLQHLDLLSNATQAKIFAYYLENIMLLSTQTELKEKIGEIETIANCIMQLKDIDDNSVIAEALLTQAWCASQMDDSLIELSAEFYNRAANKLFEDDLKRAIALCRSGYLSMAHGGKTLEYFDEMVKKIIICESYCKTTMETSLPEDFLPRSAILALSEMFESIEDRTLKIKPLKSNIKDGLVNVFSESISHQKDEDKTTTDLNALLYK